MAWLAYLHPLAMLAVLVLGLGVLREGLRVRRARLRRRRFDSGRHRRLGRWFVGLALLGFSAGLGSAVGLRDMPPLGSVHAWFACSALVGLAGAGGLGLWLERGGGMSPRTLHMLCGGLGLLAALGGAVAGFAILP